MKIWNIAMGVFVTAFGACAAIDDVAPPPPPPQPEAIDPNAQSIGSGFLLDPENEQDFKRRAEGGDRDAAFRLAFHFMSSGKYDEAKHWQLTAAKAGHPVAQYSQWFDLKERRDCISMNEALTWLEEAAAGGEKGAQRKLESYREKVASCIRSP